MQAKVLAKDEAASPSTLQDRRPPRLAEDAGVKPRAAAGLFQDRGAVLQEVGRVVEAAGRRRWPGKTWSTTGPPATAPRR
jgi:hypothetical protein